MKTYFCTLIFTCLFWTSIFAQHTTPGNNLSLTLNDLVNSSGGVVSFANGTYFINNTLTISATDTLKVTSPETIRTAANIRIEVFGTIISNPASGKVLFSAQDTNSVATNFRGFRFENSNANVFRNTTITHGGGLQLIGSQALFEYCTFRRNGSSNVSNAITYSGCSPIIHYCHFIENERSAIGSGANVLGSPQIMYSTFIRNTTDNSNRPQINLGPGGADTIYIVGNYVEGFYDNAGGIAISNLVGAGNVKAVIRDNYVVNNRYGYAQLGNTISSVISDNVFKDNNIQNQPMLGGSGINLQAAGSGNTAIIRRNIITGNLWGITTIDQAQPNLGTGLNPGGNIFYDNGNSGQTYALYNNTALTINAIGNYWGTNDAAVAEGFIFHQPDDPSLGLVLYQPVLQLFPHISSFAFLASDNLQLTEDVYGVVNQMNSTVEVQLPAGTNLDNLVPHIVTALGVAIDPESGTVQNFSQPVVYSLSVPHGLQQDWTVVATLDSELFDISFIVRDKDTALPLEGAFILLDGSLEAYTNADGVAIFEGLEPGKYLWEISLENYLDESGLANLLDENLLIEVELTTTVGFGEKEEPVIGLFPNPAVSQITYRIGGEKGGMVIITDQSGKVVYSQYNTVGEGRIHIEEWPSGSYIFIFRSETGQSMHRFIKK